MGICSLFLPDYLKISNNQGFLFLETIDPIISITVYWGSTLGPAMETPYEGWFRGITPGFCGRVWQGCATDALFLCTTSIDSISCEVNALRIRVRVLGSVRLQLLTRGCVRNSTAHAGVSQHKPWQGLSRDPMHL